MYRYAKVEFNSAETESVYYQRINALRNVNTVKGVYPYFKRGNATPISTSNIFYVKLKSAVDVPKLQQAASQKGVEILGQMPYMPLWYKLSVSSNSLENSISMTNFFFETGLFAKVDPAFGFHFRPNCTNDPNLSWGIKNNAYNGIDVNACKAWLVSEGLGVKVAIVDNGIDKSHIDLQGNIHHLSYDTETNQNSSDFNQDHFHGTPVGSIVAAVKDNGLFITGVAPQSKLMSVSNSLAQTNTISGELASGISWAWQHGADVINCSWGDQGGYAYSILHSEILEDAILASISNGRQGKGTPVVFASGNYGYSEQSIDYPANFDERIICVGNIKKNGQRNYNSGYGLKLDVVAPGEEVDVLLINNGHTNEWGGTSWAAPHVSGIIALMLSVNPCLTSSQIQNIIELTAKKVGNYQYRPTNGRPNGNWNIEMGYGLVDALAAVTLAQQVFSNELDLFIADGVNDYGFEPNTTTTYMWTSPDIWVRNQNDNGLTHQNPEYDPFQPNYVNIRVRNKSCVASNGSEQLQLYWSKAGTSLYWPNSWNGNTYHQGISMGAPIGEVTIPVIDPNSEVIITIPWLVPNPENYSTINPEPWHFCLLVRIVSEIDPMAFPETQDLNQNVRNNNNVAWKNISVVDLNKIENDISSIGGTFYISNPYATTQPFSIEVFMDCTETGKPIFQEAEVTVKLDEVLFTAWNNEEIEGMVVAGKEEKTRIIRGNNVAIKNLSLRPTEIGTMSLFFNFLTKEATPKSEFTYHAVQKNEQGEVIGGETFEIRKKIRNPFYANAGNNVEGDYRETVTLQAQEISEPAMYNWYNDANVLIGSTPEIPVTIDRDCTYKLEVIALSDGYKDYDEVDVKLKDSYILNVSPNPVSQMLSVIYKLNRSNSASILVIGSYGSNYTSQEYSIHENTSETNINMVQLPMGFYTVALVCDGQIVDTKSVFKY